MAPSAVLTFLPTTHSIMTSNTNSTNTTHNNNVLIPIACNSGPTAILFCVYQQNLFGLNEISIYTLVSDTTSAEPYRKALIIKLFFRQILPLSENASVFFSDMMTTAASYFSTNTGFTARETESTA